MQAATGGRYCTCARICDLIVTGSKCGHAGRRQLLSITHCCRAARDVYIHVQDTQCRPRLLLLLLCCCCCCYYYCCCCMYCLNWGQFLPSGNINASTAECRSVNPSTQLNRDPCSIKNASPVQPHKQHKHTCARDTSLKAVVNCMGLRAGLPPLDNSQIYRQ